MMKTLMAANVVGLMLSASLVRVRHGAGVNR
jgi:hypothetical protein